MTYTTEKTEEKENTKPDFAILIDMLRAEVSRSCQLTSRVYNRAENLKPYNLDNEKSACTAKQESTCVLNVIATEAYELRKANDKLEIAVNHLTQIIGI